MRISDWSSDVCSSDLYHVASEQDCSCFHELNANEAASIGRVPQTASGRAIFRFGVEQQRPTHRNHACAIDAQDRDCPAHGVHHGGKAHPPFCCIGGDSAVRLRSEEHTSDLPSLMRTSSSVFILKTT